MTLLSHILLPILFHIRVWQLWPNDYCICQSESRGPQAYARGPSYPIYRGLCQQHLFSIILTILMVEIYIFREGIITVKVGWGFWQTNLSSISIPWVLQEGGGCRIDINICIIGAAIHHVHAIVWLNFLSQNVNEFEIGKQSVYDYSTYVPPCLAPCVVIYYWSKYAQLVYSYRLPEEVNRILRSPLSYIKANII